MNQIDPAGLHRVLKQYFGSHHYDGLFTASLDHSPTEQLVGEHWHTSALILSAAVEHGALARELGEIANPSTRRLTTWRRANSHYRRRFCASLMSSLGRHRVMVFAISATEQSIVANENHFLDELGATQHYRRHMVGGRMRVSMGPFLNVRTSEKQTLELPENQAPMVLFIAHFLKRIHQEVYFALSSRPVTWNFYADKPPGGSGRALDNAFAMLLGLSDPRGALRWGYFLEDDDVEIDLLADNIAGLLNENVRVPHRYSFQFDEPSGEADGLLYWEKWT